MKYSEVMTKQADAMSALNELLDKGKGALAKLAPGELGWGAVGAGGGAAALRAAEERAGEAECQKK